MRAAFAIRAGVAEAGRQTEISGPHGRGRVIGFIRNFRIGHDTHRTAIIRQCNWAFTPPKKSRVTT
jgi:hypothetical protein